MNIPGLSDRTLQSSIAQHLVTVGADIQVSTLSNFVAVWFIAMCDSLQYSVLDKAKEAHPTATWWIGADIVDGLGESTCQKWTGDVDLCDGKLQKSYKEYIDRLSFVSGIGLDKRNCKNKIEEDLHSAILAIKKDLDFVTAGM